MINKETEKIIKDLIKCDIKYPLIVRGFNNSNYTVHDIYISSGNIMMSIGKPKFNVKLSDYSITFQVNLINKLKSFKDNIWDD